MAVYWDIQKMMYFKRISNVNIRTKRSIFKLALYTFLHFILSCCLQSQFIFCQISTNYFFVSFYIYDIVKHIWIRIGKMWIWSFTASITAWNTNSDKGKQTISSWDIERFVQNISFLPFSETQILGANYLQIKGSDYKFWKSVLAKFN